MIEPRTFEPRQRRQRLALHWQILIGLALGVSLGLALNRWGATVRAFFNEHDAAWLADVAVGLNQVIGDIFKRSLQFIAVPIILFAMILAIGSLGDLRKLGRIGSKTILLFLATATLSVTVGLVLVNTIQPGGSRFIAEETRAKLLESNASDTSARVLTAAKSTKPWDLVREIMPTNPFDALARGDMLQVVVLALMLGIALAVLPRDRSGPVLAVVEGLNEAFLLIVRAIMRLAPVGVFCLITPIAANLGFDVLVSLGAYCLTVILGLLVIQLVIYPAVVVLFARMPLRHFFRGIAQVQMVAFSSSSSAATLPVTMQAVRDKLGVPSDIASFVCAMGAKINMDGTALMQAVATVFLAQFYGKDLSLAQQASIVLTAVMAAIGSPGIPSGGMVMLVIVLRSYAVPAEGIAMILAVDRILDMCRTVVNVTGDAAAAVAVAGMERRRGG
ncbi:MAG: dicarboxylate/amino acid:cation symporter [Phycisphaerales bacterium]